MSESTKAPSTFRPEDLQGLLDLASELLQHEDYDQVLDVLVQRSLEILCGDRGFVVLKQGEGLAFKRIRNWSRDELEGQGEPVSRSIVKKVLAGGEPLLIEDALSDKRLAKMESVLRMGIRSVLAAPLEVEGRRVGALYLESRSLDRLFGRYQLQLFQRILELSSRALESCMRRILLAQRNSVLERDILARYDFPGIITRDQEMLKILQTVAQVAKSELPILIQGPSGTGKELIAQALYLNSPRAKGPFVPVNCGAISPTIIESVLFGHLKGAFTGATADRAGMIASADGGTVFLDEVGELPQELQVKLLRTLQFGEIQPVGASRPRIVDVRFVAATNRNLEEEVQNGTFREDLFYRLNVITIDLPPLVERQDDILPLFYHFLKEATEKEGRPQPRVSPKLERTLQEYRWPGNVRDLKNEAQRLLAVTPEGMPLTVEQLSRRITEPAGGVRKVIVNLQEQEKEHVEMALRATGGNRTRAAKMLGISREGLRKKMKRFGLD